MRVARHRLAARGVTLYHEPVLAMIQTKPLGEAIRFRVRRGGARQGPKMQKGR